MREAREETGYDIELLRLLGEDAFTVPPSERTGGARRPLRSIRLVFEARVVGGPLNDEAGGTTDRAAWIPLAGVARRRAGAARRHRAATAQRCPKWWARGRAVTTSGAEATRRARCERLSSWETSTFRFRSTRS